MPKPKYRILVIEDNSEDQELYRQYLCQTDECAYDFTAVQSAKEGIDLYRRFEYDCVLLDYQLPDMDGVRVLEQLRDQHKIGLPVVMITGRGDERLAVRALKLGAADYLVKSNLTPESVFRATQNAIEKHRTAVRLEEEHNMLVEALERESAALVEARRERERLRLFFARMPNPVAVLRGSQLILEFTNEPMRRLLGDHNIELAPQLRPLGAVLGREVLDLAELVYKSGKAFNASEFEIDRAWAPGERITRRYFNLVFEPLRERNEEVSGLIFVMTDISDQVRARHQLEESEQRAKEGELRFRQIAEVVPLLIWVTNAEGNGEYFNSAWLSSTGTESADNLGLHWLDRLHEADFLRLSGQWKESLASGRPFETTGRLRSPVGDDRWYLFRALPIRDGDGRISGWYGAAADVHEQRMVTDILRSSEKRLALATSNSGVGIWEFNLTTGQSWRSFEHDQLFGYKTPAKVWNYEIFLSRVNPEDRARVREGMETAMGLRQPFSLEFRIDWPDQSVRWVSVKGSLETRGDGHDVYSGTTIDVTERKKREQDLADAKNYAVAANETKTAFLANMSHEIRTPLSAIMGFTDLLATEELSPAEKSSFAETVRRNGNGLMQIIDDILDLSKIEAGRFEIDLEPTDLRSVVDDIVRLFRPKAAEKGVELRANIGAEVPARLTTDPVRFRQILLNAVSNAVKFTQKGSIELNVTRANTDAGSPGWVVFAITDTGLGIADEHQQRLFQPFSQADNSMTRRFGGTGLGLMLARRLAKLIGGAYYLARTKVGEGSTFELRLPFEEAVAKDAVEGTRTEPARKIAQRSQLLRGSRILLVEDSPDNRLLVRLYLERHGAAVETAENGAEALLRVGASSYDLVITDIQMPVMDGYETTRKLRGLGFQKPIIGLTAHVFREDRERSLDAGLDAHLGKPVQADELVRTVDEHLSRG